LLISSQATAGPFLNLGIGHVIGDYNATNCIPNSATVSIVNNQVSGVHIDCQDGAYLGNSGLLGKAGIGYETKSYPLSFGLKIKGSARIEHMSDPRLSDGGLNYGMIDTTIHF
jgi:hypothetical protein